MPEVTLEVILPVPTLQLAVSYTGPTQSDISNQLAGRTRIAECDVFYEPPVAAVPAGVVRVPLVDKVIVLPAPEFVDGRPT